MKNIVFSIITCTKNSGKFILRNIQSVDKQTFRNFEHIFIDGKSNDGTLNIIKSFVKKRPGFYKLFSLPPLGISNAFNKGIEESKGEYLFFLNSDDYFYDNLVLNDIYEFLSKNKKLDWIYGKINVVEENGKTIGVFPNRRIFQNSNKKLLKYINYIPHQGVFIKRKIFEEFGGFDESLKTSMDKDLWLRISNNTEWRFFDKIVSGYTVRSDAASSSKKMIKENINLMETVQKRYLNSIEMIFARIINRFIFLVNKTHR